MLRHNGQPSTRGPRMRDIARLKREELKAQQSLKPFTRRSPREKTSSGRPIHRRGLAQDPTLPLRDKTNLQHVAATATKSTKPAKADKPGFVSTRPLFTRRVIDLPATREKLRIKKLPPHPLSVELDDATELYKSDLQTAALSTLYEKHDSLLAHLKAGLYTLPTSTFPFSQPDESPAPNSLTPDQLIQHHLATSDAMQPLSAEKLLFRRATKPRGPEPSTSAGLEREREENGKLSTLGESMTRFSHVLREEEQSLRALQREHLSLLAEIRAFAELELGLGTGAPVAQMSGAHGGSTNELPEGAPAEEKEALLAIREIEEDIAALGETELRDLEHERREERERRRKMFAVLQAL